MILVTKLNPLGRRLDVGYVFFVETLFLLVKLRVKTMDKFFFCFGRQDRRTSGWFNEFSMDFPGNESICSFWANFSFVLIGDCFPPKSLPNVEEIHCPRNYVLSFQENETIRCENKHLLGGVQLAKQMNF